MICLAMEMDRVECVVKVKRTNDSDVRTTNCRGGSFGIVFHLECCIIFMAGFCLAPEAEVAWAPGSSWCSCRPCTPLHDFHPADGMASLRHVSVCRQLERWVLAKRRPTTISDSTQERALIQEVQAPFQIVHRVVWRMVRRTACHSSLCCGGISRRLLAWWGVGPYNFEILPHDLFWVARCFVLKRASCSLEMAGTS